MKKRLLLPTLALCTALSACGGSKSAEQTTAVVETTEAVTRRLAYWRYLE